MAKDSPELKRFNQSVGDECEKKTQYGWEKSLRAFIEQ